MLFRSKANTNYDDLSRRATDAFSGWSTQDPQVYFDKIREVLQIIEEVVDLVEKFAKEADALSNRDKLDAAVEFLDDLVKFNFLIEMIDGVVIRMLISSVVQQKNKWFGQNWFKNS